MVEHLSKWALLLDAIGHVASVAGISDQRACEELRRALRDGAVESRRVGQDENIAPTDWYRTRVLPDGSVIFNYDGRFDYGTPILDPSRPDHLVSYHVEVRRADVLRIWPEKPIEVPRRERMNPPSITPDQRRERRILRFRECQKRRRRWLGFWDIADWIACDRGATDRRDEQLRAQGYSDLFDAVLTGHFDQRGRSCVLYLSPDSEKLRLIAERLREMRDIYAGTTTINEEVLSRCWVPRSLAQRWFERRGIAWPARFDPSTDSAGGGTLASASVTALKEAEAPSNKKTKPTPEEVFCWMHGTVKRGAKRDDVIGDCRAATGATFRQAKAAWNRLPAELKLKRGQRAGLPKIER